MIDITIVDKAVQLKKESDAAYLVFKRTPTVENSTKWSTASRRYTDYCVGVITGLVNDRIDAITKVEDIVNNFDKYRKCHKCEAELLFPTTEGKYIASSDFIEDFSGWCYPCLVDYCTTHDCETCSVVEDHRACKFTEVKKLQEQGDE